MAVAALALFVVFMLLAGGVRTLIQRRRTGDTGNRRTWAARGSLEWWGLAVADLGYLTVGLGAPVAALAGVPPLAIVDHPVVRGVGVVLVILGILATFGAQLALGTSWRIGVDQAERTPLVITGPFRLVRNPVFTAAASVFLGLALMVPNVVAIAGLAVTLIGIEIQVRLVEEPYLHGVHGAAYTDYASGVGRVAVLPTMLDHSVHLGQLAAAVGISASRLGHLFSDELGLPFRAYVRWARLQRAIDHARQGSTLTDAAHAAGFADSAHLTRVCHEMFGLAPSLLARAVHWHEPVP